MKRLPKINQVNSDTFNLSISDLMAGLLAIFVLVLCYFILNFNQATSQLNQNNLKRAAILMEIQEEMRKNGFEVKIDTEHGILHIPEGVLFDIGEADISKDEGKKIVEKLSMIMSDVLSSEEYYGSVETVFIEGHTDNIPIKNNKFPSNWELSTKRAINTWLTMQHSQSSLNTLMNKNNQPVFSCSGYADTRPVADNSTDQGRKENRRIDIRFSMSSPNQEDQELVKFVKSRM